MLTFKMVLDQIRSTIDPQNPVKGKYHIIVIPFSLFIYEDALEELGLFDSVIKLHSLQWQSLHIDEGILSLEFPKMYKQLFLCHNYSLLPAFARSLWSLSFVIGRPSFVMALGKLSRAVLQQLDMLCEDISASDRFDSDFGGWIIMDRSVDYPSALLTPGTYSALLNEVYGVHCGICECKEQTVENYDSKYNPMVKKGPVSLNLNEQDPIYKDLKNRYFTEVTSVLSNLTKQLCKENANSKEMALDEIKHYIKTQLQVAQSKKKFIANHLTASETIINLIGPRFEQQQQVEQNIMQNKAKSANFAYLEELISSENNEFVSLRLFCLMCITQRLSESEIKTFWKKYLHEYGYKHSFAYDNLISAGFVTETTTNSLPNKIIKMPLFDRNNFYTNLNKLKQMPADPDKIDLKHPTCCSYVFGGTYIPLVAQIASMLLNSTPLEEIKSKLELLGSLNIKNERGYPLQPRCLFVLVVGGVTYAEIAACNLLEVLTGAKIVIMSDNIITGNDLMKGMLTLPEA